MTENKRRREIKTHLDMAAEVSSQGRKRAQIKFSRGLVYPRSNGGEGFNLLQFLGYSGLRRRRGETSIRLGILRERKRRKLLQLDILQDRRKNLPSEPVKPLKVDSGRCKNLSFQSSCSFLPFFSLQIDQVSSRQRHFRLHFPHSRVSLATAIFRCEVKWGMAQILHSNHMKLA